MLGNVLVINNCIGRDHVSSFGENIRTPQKYSSGYRSGYWNTEFTGYQIPNDIRCFPSCGEVETGVGGMCRLSMSSLQKSRTIPGKINEPQNVPIGTM